LTRRHLLNWTQFGGAILGAALCVILPWWGFDYVLPIAFTGIFLLFFWIVAPQRMWRSSSRTGLGPVAGGVAMGLFAGPVIAGFVAFIGLVFEDLFWWSTSKTEVSTAVLQGFFLGGLLGGLSGLFSVRLETSFARSLFKLAGHTRWVSAVS